MPAQKMRSKYGSTYRYLELAPALYATLLTMRRSSMPKISTDQASRHPMIDPTAPGETFSSPDDYSSLVKRSAHHLPLVHPQFVRAWTRIPPGLHPRWHASREGGLRSGAAGSPKTRSTTSDGAARARLLADRGALGFDLWEVCGRAPRTGGQAPGPRKDLVDSVGDDSTEGAVEEERERKDEEGAGKRKWQGTGAEQNVFEREGEEREKE